VEAYFCGQGSDVTRIIEWLHSGPETAVVDKVDVEETDTEKLQAHDFIIKS
jgi:acylphosphatase